MSDSESIELPSHVRNALLEIYKRHDQPMIIEAASGVGENIYGQVLRISWPTLKDALSVVVKMAPKNEARRAHTRVADYYKREVFMYEYVFRAYKELAQETGNHFDVTPALITSGLQPPEEFIIFEDLNVGGYTRNARSSMPTSDLVISSVKALAELHGLSFALQHKKPEKFSELIDKVKNDNLFTHHMEAVSIEFGRAQLRRTQRMLQDEEQTEESRLMQRVIKNCDDKFKDFALYSVDGASQSPYAVICHGDFWNNNILYKNQSATNDGKTIDAKLIDFQMSRYAPPVLDLVHYLFACTEKPLRDINFESFMDIYHETVALNLKIFNLDIENIYPRHIFDRQLCDFGVYGLIMAAFSMPFFVSQADEIVNIDKVSEAIQDLSATSSDEDAPKCQELIEEFEMLNERTLPIFKRRMTGVVSDIIKYKMAEKLFQL
ncbi:uncharacterized protein [Drosophila tropicalis]|uniref:uncharacterized protein n=1 Tax=Drosophila tropicalis TaxID=46794 RepID=UPI0035AB9620